LNIRFNYEVNSILKLIDGTFSINDGDIIAEKVFIGVGVVPKEIPFQVHPTIKAYTYATMPLDKEVYRDKTVVIVGLGNAALETADFIAPVTKFTVMSGRNNQAWKSHFSGHIRSKNLASIDSFFLKAGTFIDFVQDDADKYTDTMEYQKIRHLLQYNDLDIFGTIDIAIFCTGFKFMAPFVSDLVDICPDTGFPLLTSQFESTKTSNVFFIGCNTQGHDFKKGTSSVIHGFRFNCEYLSRHLKGIEPEILTSRQMMRKVFRQLNTSPCLLHRFNYFCDVIEKLPNDMWKYTKEIPIRKASDTEFTIQLGYTSGYTSDSYQQDEFPFPKNANQSPIIHPIIRTATNQFDIPGDPCNIYDVENWHVLPFRIFIDFFTGVCDLQTARRRILAIDERRGQRNKFYLKE
jgi:thioredoxin reductase